MKALQLTETDTIATALEEIPAGQTVAIVMNGRETGRLAAREVIPYGFKIAVRAMAAGDAVVKYGHVIGKASRAIAAGDLVHVHNIEGCRGRGDLAR